MSRLYPERPILAASAAVFRPDGRVLLAARIGAPYDQVFSLPGGVVEPGETLAQAACRECLEETGVVAGIAGFAGHAEVIEKDEEGRIRRHFVVAAFAARWISGEGTTGPEAAALVWADPDDIAALRLTPGLTDILDRARSLIGGMG